MSWDYHSTIFILLYSNFLNWLVLLSYLSDSDDDEDIMVHRKPHRNAIRDSDSEEEAAAADSSVHMAEALVLSASSGEEMETKKEKGRQKCKRISRAPVDSEDSEPEEEKSGKMEEEEGKVVKRKVKSTKEVKEREKSRRHHEKKEKHSKAVEKLKKKERFSERDEVSSLVSELFLAGVWYIKGSHTHGQ